MCAPARRYPLRVACERVELREDVEDEEDTPDATDASEGAGTIVDVEKVKREPLLPVIQCDSAFTSPLSESMPSKMFSLSQPVAGDDHAKPGTTPLSDPTQDRYPAISCLEPVCSAPHTLTTPPHTVKIILAPDVSPAPDIEGMARVRRAFEEKFGGTNVFEIEGTNVFEGNDRRGRRGGRERGGRR